MASDVTHSECVGTHLPPRRGGGYDLGKHVIRQLMAAAASAVLSGVATVVWVCLHWPRASPLSQYVLHPKPFCPACVPLEGGQGVPFFPFTPLLPPTFARLSPTTTTPAFTNSFTLLLLRCKGGICHRKKCNLPQIPPLPLPIPIDTNILVPLQQPKKPS